jgi:hypothetical protein
MNAIPKSVVGVDTAKSVFQLYTMDNLAAADANVAG